jgi:ParB family transcriptional regulator, chromosome partitioning protein
LSGSTKLQNKNNRRLDKKEQLQKAIFGNTAVQDLEDNDTDYAAMFVGREIELEKAPSEEASVDIHKLRAAPGDWNFFSSLPEHKMYELVESIESIGLQNRIIVWEEANKENYIILSGHNRFKAFEMIYNATQDEQYKFIPAKIYKHEDITMTEAKEIIVDTNFVQRSLRPIERARSIVMKINLINEKRTSDMVLGRTRDIVAERYGLKGRMVENYRKLIDLSHHFMEMVNSRELTIVSGAKLATFSKEMQQWIFDNFYDRLDNSVVGKLRKGMTKDEITEVFKAKAQTETDRTRIRVEIPYGLEKEFSRHFEEWAEQKNLTSRDFKIYIK